MAVGGDKALDNVVGFSKKYGLLGHQQAGNYSAKRCQKLNQLDDVGEVEEGTFSVEKSAFIKT